MTQDVGQWTNIVAEDKVEDLIRSLRANLEPYGAVVVGSTINVLAGLATGESPEDAAKDVSFELTGFQMGAVASMVSQLAPRGEEFRRWWNLHTQIGNEGERANEGDGVLNPALMTIDADDD